MRPSSPHLHTALLVPTLITMATLLLKFPDMALIVTFMAELPVLQVWNIPPLPMMTVALSRVKLGNITSTVLLRSPPLVVVTGLVATRRTNVKFLSVISDTTASISITPANEDLNPPTSSPSPQTAR